MKLNTVYFNNLKQYDQQRYYYLQDSEFIKYQKSSMDSIQESTNDKEQIQKFIQYESQKVKKKINLQTMTFNPQNTLIIFWRLTNAICSYIFFFETPLILAYQNSQLFAQDTSVLFMTINIFCILIFMINIGVKLKTAFYKDGILINNPKQIIYNYFFHSFYIDIVSLAVILPIQIERIKYILDLNHEIQYYWISLFFYIKIIQVVDIVQSINKALQLHRKSKAIFNLLLLLVHILLISTVYASIFFYISKQFCLTNINPDPAAKIYICWIESVNSSGLPLDDPSQPWFVQYGFSLYWAATTMISIGYGDITPKNPREVYFTIFAQFTSCVLYAYSINKIWQVKNQFEYQQQKYQRKVNVINRYMRDKSVSSLLKSKINAYLAHFYMKQKIRQRQQQSEVINQLAPLLKQELIMEVYGFIFKQFKIFKIYSEDFLIQISQSINQVRYSENQIIQPPEIDQVDYKLNYIYTGEIQLYLQLGQYGQIKKLVKKIPRNRMFGVYQFYTGLIGITRASATCYSSIYNLTYHAWKQKLQYFIDDYEKFCQVRDLAKYQKRMKNLKIQCDFCSSDNHITQFCSYQSIRSEDFLCIKNYRQTQNLRSQYNRDKINRSFHMRNKTQINELKFFQAGIKKQFNESQQSVTSSIQDELYSQQKSVRQLKKIKNTYSSNKKMIRKLSLNVQNSIRQKKQKIKQGKVNLNIQQAQQILNNLNQKKFIKPSLIIDKKQSYGFYFKNYNIENIVIQSMRLDRFSSFRSRIKQ